MFTLFSRIILSNWRSLWVLFFIILFASTGFVTLRQITTNIESLVATKTKPLFGADLIVSVRSYASGDILPAILPYLKNEQYQAAEKREFSTTLLDKDGKTGLVNVVAYSGSYPQRGILKTLSGNYVNLVVVTPGLYERFSSGGRIVLDGRVLPISDIISESSDLGFSLGTENHLIILPSSLLSGSLLLASGSRLDHDLLISFSRENRAGVVAAKLKEVLPENLYRIRTYEDRSEQNLDTVDTLADYITLILFISSIFAFVILRSAHESFFESIARTLRVTEILGLTQRRQRILLLMLYGIIFPIASLLGVGISDLIIETLRRTPEGADFIFFWSSVPRAFLLLFTIVVMAWFPVWWNMRRDNTDTKSPGLEISQSSYKKMILLHIGRLFRYVVRIDIFVSLVLGILLLFLLFGDPIFSLSVGSIGALFLLIFGYIINLLYKWIFKMAGGLRSKEFYLYDAIRALVRPLTPTLPITISLVLVSVFFIVFAHFSLAFRSKLTVDSNNTANMYAINLFESDKKQIQNIIGSGALMYDILRARISKINNQSLSSHFGVERPSGEFTREFNITTTPLENPIVKGKKTIGTGEVSVDDEFSRRLGVDIGDSVTFLLSGREVTLKVTSIRESQREGFRPFFYFSFDPTEFANAPRTYFLAEYASDTELWKKNILSASGPHVTFIDIENILKIVRDISDKILSVIGLFGAVILLFAVGAIVAFFTRIKPVENMKSRLYSLFGARTRSIRTSLEVTRISLFVVSYILSIIIGGILSYIILSRSTFFVFSFSDFLLIIGIIGLLYILLILAMRRE